MSHRVFWYPVSGDDYRFAPVPGSREFNLFLAISVGEMEDTVVEISAEEEILLKAIEPLLESEGFEVVQIRLKRSQSKSILAIFVDTLNRKNGVVLENLTDISRLLSDFLDAQFSEGNLLAGRYDLEVSSPGLDRPLRKRSHFSDAVGQRIKIRLKPGSMSGFKSVTGALREVLEAGVRIAPDHQVDKTMDVLFKDMSDAHIVFDFSKTDGKTKKQNG